MAKWNVTVPICGSIYFPDIEADSEEEAIELAMQKDISDYNIEDLNMYEHVMEGNVCNLDCSDAEAVLDEEE